MTFKNQFAFLFSNVGVAMHNKASQWDSQTAARFACPCWLR